MTKQKKKNWRQIKDEVGNANFYVVYSHSLFVCGIVQVQML
jgi:hypothetical protein